MKGKGNAKSQQIAIESMVFKDAFDITQRYNAKQRVLDDLDEKLQKIQDRLSEISNIYEAICGRDDILEHLMAAAYEIRQSTIEAM